MSQDDEHLRLLSVFYYVVAGLCALFALLPLVHLAIGVAMVTGGLGGVRGRLPEVGLGWFIIVFASFWIAAGLAFAGCLAVAGKLLRERRRHTFCLVVAAVACAFMPFGTVLGIFSILVLSRESVRASFDAPGTLAVPG